MPKKTIFRYLFPLGSIFVAAVIFLLLYNHYLLDSSLANLGVVLSTLGAQKQLGDTKQIVDILSDTFIIELSKADFDLPLALKLELSAQMLENVSKQEQQKYEKSHLTLSSASNIEFAATIAANISRQTQIKDAKYFIQEAINAKKKAENRPAFFSKIDDLLINFFPQPRKENVNILKNNIKKIVSSLPAYKGEELQGKYLEIAKLYLLMKDWQNASLYLDKSLALNPKSPTGLKAQFFLGITYKLKGDFDKAISIFTEINNSLPKDLREFSSYQVADCLYKSGDKNKALALFEEIFARDKASEIAQLSQFRAAYNYLYDLADMPKAKDTFAKLKQNIILTDIKRYVEDKINADLARQYCEDGFILIEEGFHKSIAVKYEEALTKFDLALATSPRYATATIGKALAFCFLNKPMETLVEGEKAKDAAPEDAEVLANLGFIYYLLDMPDKAISEFEAAIKNKSDVPVLHYNLGTLYLLREQYHKAKKHLQIAVMLDPQYVRAYNNLGYALWVLGNYSEAKENFNKAAALKPDYIEGHYNLGAVYYALGNYEQAFKEFKRAEELQPNFRKTKQFFTQLREKLGY